MRALYMIFLLFSPLVAFTQQGNEQQREVAKRYIKLIRSGEYEKSWDLFDKENNPTVTKTIYITQIKGVVAMIPEGDLGELQEFLYLLKYANDQVYSVYSFKFEKDVSKPMPGFSLDVIFVDNKTLLVGGLQPKKLQLANPADRKANSSAGKETPITGKSEWNVNGKKYQVIGVNIIHFKGNEAVVAVQVAYPVTTKLDTEVAKKEAKLLAKHLYKSKDYKKAKKEMKKQGLNSLKKLGVSFINPATGQGWNTLVPEGEYK